jgi:hypothetical protein
LWLSLKITCSALRHQPNAVRSIKHQRAKRQEPLAKAGDICGWILNGAAKGLAVDLMSGVSGTNEDVPLRKGLARPRLLAEVLDRFLSVLLVQPSELQVGKNDRQYIPLAFPAESLDFL